MKERYKVVSGIAVKQNILSKDLINDIGYSESYKKLQRQAGIKTAAMGLSLILATAVTIAILFGTMDILGITLYSLVFALIITLSFFFASFGWLVSQDSNGIFKVSVNEFAEANQVTLEQFGYDVLEYVEEDGYVVTTTAMLTSKTSIKLDKDFVWVVIDYKKDSVAHKLIVELQLTSDLSLVATGYEITVMEGDQVTTKTFTKNSILDKSKEADYG